MLWMPIGVISTMAKLVILIVQEIRSNVKFSGSMFSWTHQLVAVETATPFVLMGSELISVG